MKEILEGGLMPERIHGIETPEAERFCDSNTENKTMHCIKTEDCIYSNDYLFWNSH
jgi:hypothetical protein